MRRRNETAARFVLRALMNKFREIGKLWAGIAVLGCALFVAGIFSQGQNVRDFLGNPLGFSSRVTPSGPVVLLQMQKLARLESARFNGQAIVKSETKGVLPVSIAGDSLLFVAHGEVVAGVDLAKMNGNDVRVDGETVRVKLPKAEIFHTRLDSKTSEVFQRQTGFFSKPDIDLETNARIESENRLREAALQSDILGRADENARDAVRQQLKSAGVKNLQFD